MSNSVEVRTHRETALKIAFVISGGILLFATSAFRPKRVLLFLAILFILFSFFFMCRRGKLSFSLTNKKSTVLASSAAIMVFCDFYLNSIRIRPRMLLHIVAIFNRIMPISFEFFIGISSLGLGILSFYALHIFADLFMRKASVLAVIAKKYKYHILLLFSTFCIASLSVLRSNYYYIDDIGRAIHGNGLTGGFSRYLSDVLAEVLHVNTWLADISPITQIVSLLILAYTGAIVLYLIYGENPPKLFHVVALIPIGLSPYFLACLSFKYDAPYMAFSILVSVIPLLFYKKNDWRYGIAVFLSILCMCTTYQASAGIFPACVLLLAFLMWTRKNSLKSIWRFTAISALGYMTALLSFRFVLMAPTSTSYVDTSISIKQIIPNIVRYFHILNDDYDAIWKLCVLIVLAVFSVCIIRSTQRNRFATAALLLVTLVGILVLSYGVNTVFENPTIDARGIYAIGVLIAIVSVITLSLDKRCLSVSAIILLSWMCIVFSTIYGNALNLQKDYTAYRMEQVLNDINEQKLLKDQENVKLQFAGSEGVSTAVRNLTGEYPMLKRLMPVLFDDTQGYYWGPKQFCGFYEETLDRVQVVYDNDYVLQDYILVKDTTNYRIYQKNDAILVIFINQAD